MTLTVRERNQNGLIASASQADMRPMPGVPLRASVDRYLLEGRRRGHFAVTTFRSYNSILMNFAKTVGIDRPTGEINLRHINTWWGSLDCAASTARHRLSVVQTFLGWCVDTGLMRRNPAAKLRPPKQPRYLPRALLSEDVAKLLAVAPHSRAKLAVLLMCQLGLRCAEVAALQVGDVDWRAGTILIHGKGGHERVVPLVAQVRQSMETYLAEHPASAGPLLRSFPDPNKGLTPGYIGDRARRLFWAAGIKRAARDGRSAHALRHTAATDMLDGGANVRTVQVALGHQSLATTQRYLAWSVEDLRRAMEGRRYG